MEQLGVIYPAPSLFCRMTYPKKSAIFGTARYSMSRDKGFTRQAVAFLILRMSLSRNRCTLSGDML
jgi:hypothetical protein